MGGGGGGFVLGLQGGAVGGVGVAEGGGVAGGKGDDEVVEWSSVDEPAGAVFAEFVDGGVGAQMVGKACGEGVGEGLHAGAEGGEEGGGFPLASLCAGLSHEGGHTEDETAVFSFELAESREGGGHAHVLGVAAVDASEQGAREPIQGLLAEVAAGEGGEAFVLVGSSGFEEGFEGHPEFGGHSQQAGGEDGGDFLGDKEFAAGGEGMQASAVEDGEGSLVVVGGEEFVLESKFSAEVEAPGFFGEEGVGSAFEKAAVETAGENFAAEVGGGLEDGGGGAGFAEIPGGG